MAKTRTATGKAAGTKTKAGTTKRGTTAPAKGVRKAAAATTPAARKAVVAKKTAGAAAQRGAQRMAQPSAPRKTAAPRKSPAAKSAGKRGSPARPRLGDAPRQAQQEGATPQQLAHRLNALLHTMQTIQHFEETLCSLMHAMRRGRLSAPHARELKATLQELPVAEYRDDVDALLHDLR